MTVPSDQTLAALQQRLGYTFRDPVLLMRAVTHPSFLHEHPDAGESNQRLEFLGDAVIQLVLTEALFELLPGEPEGVLSKSRASLSKGVFLCQLARQLDLGACLRLSTSEEQTGGRNRASALEDAFESLMGALYLDSNLETARRIILALYGPLTPRLATIQPSENPKGRLQELVQPLHGNHALRYEVIAIHGEDHAREYEVQLFLNDQPLGIGRGTSKKSAEEQAARLGLEKLDTAAPG